MEKTNIIFLDMDGVLNCEVFYQQVGYPKDLDNYEEENLCRKRIKWLSDLCKDTNSVVVVSSSWRSGKTVDYFQDIFDRLEGEFQVVGMTKYLHFQQVGDYGWPSTPRGCEIKHFLTNTLIPYRKYAILDDDGDMLLEQAPHFFQTDPYSGLTPYLCQRIKDHLLS